MRRLVPVSSLPALRPAAGAFALVLALILTAAACGGGSTSDAQPSASSSPAADPGGGGEPPAVPAATGGSATEPAAPATGGELGMVSSRGQRVAAQPAADPGSGGTSGNGIAFKLPESWKEEPPSSSMRMAQASIPGPGGDGQLTVFFFGVGGGGGVEANLQRWAGQVQAEAGTEPLRDTFEAGAFKVHYLEVGGTILPSQMGTGPTTPQPDHRLIGAVVEGPGGPWFFKATGPEATMDAQRDAFKKMLRELKSEV